MSTLCAEGKGALLKRGELPSSQSAKIECVIDPMLLAQQLVSSHVDIGPILVECVRVTSGVWTLRGR